MEKIEEDFMCPTCKGKVFKKIEKGEIVLGEEPKKNYERYDCHACRLFWEKGDVNCVKDVGGKDGRRRYIKHKM